MVAEPTTVDTLGGDTTILKSGDSGGGGLLPPPQEAEKSARNQAIPARTCSCRAQN